MSFNHNKLNIIKSIQLAKEKGASYRLGPELEVPGYGCEDHFFELDTVKHSWNVLQEILSHKDLTKDIICDIGMPVHHKNTLYNCRVICLNQEIILIRPKIFLAAGNNYRESRWFTPWLRHEGRAVEEFRLSPSIQAIKGQEFTKFGNAIIQCHDTEIGIEICEEMWVPRNPHIEMGLDGVEIFMNSSSSHHELRKLKFRHDLIQSATQRNGGIYVYSNLVGCDGGRVYYDGSSMISMNGRVFGQAKQFSPDNVEMLIGVMDLDEVKSIRGSNTSRNAQSSRSRLFERVKADIYIARQTELAPSKEIKLQYNRPEEEIAQGPALWMWDYLRRSGARGFFLPFSGGADSSSTAALVASMSILVFENIKGGNDYTLQELRKVVRDPKFTPTTWKDIVNRIFVTSYLRSKNSGEETTSRAERVAKAINSRHFNIPIDDMYNAVLKTFIDATGKTPKFESQGGTPTEDLALQNIQARSRMLFSYLMAQLMPWVTDEKGFLLVLGSSNIAESLRGYMTKYDCSSADINPIGGVNKQDLKSFLKYFAAKNDIPEFEEIANAKPTAELRPFDPKDKKSFQLDEEDMGFTYAELDEMGRLRKIWKSGPVSMFERLLFNWPDRTPREIADKVKKFFYYYSVNRHKMTVLTPSYHAEAYGTDDNRFDLRQFLYDTSWETQFEEIERIVKCYEEQKIKRAIEEKHKL